MPPDTALVNNRPTPGRLGSRSKRRKPGATWSEAANTVARRSRSRALPISGNGFARVRAPWPCSAWTRFGRAPTAASRSGTGARPNTIVRLGAPTPSAIRSSGFAHIAAGISRRERGKRWRHDFARNDAAMPPAISPLRRGTARHNRINGDASPLVSPGASCLLAPGRARRYLRGVAPTPGDSA